MLGYVGGIQNFTASDYMIPVSMRHFQLRARSHAAQQEFKLARFRCPLTAERRKDPTHTLFRISNGAISPFNSHKGLTVDGAEH